jgi:hypothetical protein
MTPDDQIQALQDELNAKDAEIARLGKALVNAKIGGGCCGSVSKSDPAFVLVYMPYPEWGPCVTVATLDHYGNLTIKVDVDVPADMDVLRAAIAEAERKLQHEAEQERTEIDRK